MPHNTPHALADQPALEFRTLMRLLLRSSDNIQRKARGEQPHRDALQQRVIPAQHAALVMERRAERQRNQRTSNSIGRKPRREHLGPERGGVAAALVVVVVGRVGLRAGRAREALDECAGRPGRDPDEEEALYVAERCGGTGEGAVFEEDAPAKGGVPGVGGEADRDCIALLSVHVVIFQDSRGISRAREDTGHVHSTSLTATRSVALAIPYASSATPPCSAMPGASVSRRMPTSKSCAMRARSGRYASAGAEPGGVLVNGLLELLVA